jgi:hypothetical protein
VDDYQKKFLKILSSISYRHSNILNDWAELSAISLYNAVMPKCKEWTKRENCYLEIVKRYTSEELKGICQMLSCVVDSLELGMHDCLGEMYMTEELRSRWDTDIAFTPWHIAHMMAKMVFSGFKLPEKGWFTVGEPACGTGVLVVAAAAALKDLGFNYQRVMHATLIDIRAPLAHMAYIQMSLLHIPAVIIHGDTLAMTEWSRWRTPAHIVGFWEGRAGRVLPHKAQFTFNFDEKGGFHGDRRNHPSVPQRRGTVNPIRSR